MHDDPILINFLTPYLLEAFNKFKPISTLSFRKSIVFVEFAIIPPTFPAALITISGLLLLNHEKTNFLFLKSNFFIYNYCIFFLLKNLTKDLPTIPL